MKDPGRVRYACKGGGYPVIELGCFVTMHDGLWKILPPYRPSFSPPHKVLVSSGYR